MPKTKEQKKTILKDLADKISRAKSIVFTKFNKLTVKESQGLRKALKGESSEYYVAKKTLMGLAFKDLKIDGLDIKRFQGQIAAIFGYGDEMAPAKTIASFKKKLEDKERIEFIGGILEGRYLAAEEVTALASLPGIQELFTKIVGSLNTPLSGLVNVLAGNLKSLVYALKAIEEKNK